MAGHAAKKLQKSAQLAAVCYRGVFYACVLAHVFFNFARGKLAGAAFLCLVGYFTCERVIAAAAIGSKASFFQDIFFVNQAVMLLTCYSAKAWWLYAVVPAYAVWSLGKFLHSWFSAQSPAAGGEPPMSKRQKKLQNKRQQDKRVQAAR